MRQHSYHICSHAVTSSNTQVCKRGRKEGIRTVTLDHPHPTLHIMHNASCKPSEDKMPEGLHRIVTSSEARLSKAPSDELGHVQESESRGEEVEEDRNWEEQTSCPYAGTYCQGMTGMFVLKYVEFTFLYVCLLMFVALPFIFSINCCSTPQFVSFIWGVSNYCHLLSSTHV